MGRSGPRTQILYGPPGSQLGTSGFDHPDRGDAARLWNLADKIPAEERFSRVFEGQRELIDHIMVSHALIGHVTEAHALHDRRLPSIDADPSARRSAPDSDHAPVLAHIDV